MFSLSPLELGAALIRHSAGFTPSVLFSILENAVSGIMNWIHRQARAHRLFSSKVITNPFFLLATSFLLHVLEEYLFGFPEWATSHFGRTTESFFLASHIPIFFIVFVVCYMASSRKSFGFLGLGLASVLAVNGIFHAATTLLFRQYSPGLVTGIFLYPPVFYFILRYCLKSGSLNRRQAINAITIGVVVSLLVVGSLFVNMPSL